MPEETRINKNNTKDFFDKHTVLHLPRRQIEKPNSLSDLRGSISFLEYYLRTGKLLANTSFMFSNFIKFNSLSLMFTSLNIVVSIADDVWTDRYYNFGEAN
ncbi:hypothetical protein TUBRATIS_27250 [Tubulinosema ratisbonensis]|uniref:Uncharacterized protein n=1 Tax=Tubulinosema ratisbonensis TaxID=291195 RepID=A0A437AI08_9MICR|nr:hypothetical protein TUBRATIS_27250 [Tubulinosema ratisbonensis]